MSVTTAVEPTGRRAATYIGLLFALFATPVYLFAFRVDVGDPTSLATYLTREGVIFGMLAALLLFARFVEGTPLATIGWKFERPWRSVLWGGVGFLLSAIGIAACLFIASYMHWKIGLQEPPKFEPPLSAVAITVLRAGVTEEAFYRGYAYERLLTATGSRWVAGLLPLVLFALFHFRQGPAGILIAFVTGAILTVLYAVRRDLFANMVTHFTVDFVPNVLLPLLGVEV
jgi:membrane protease YdiL (CAAX protease family)